ECLTRMTISRPPSVNTSLRPRATWCSSPALVRSFPTSALIPCWRTYKVLWSADRCSLGSREPTSSHRQVATSSEHSTSPRVIATTGPKTLWNRKHDDDPDQRNLRQRRSAPHRRRHQS